MVETLSEEKKQRPKRKKKRKPKSAYDFREIRKEERRKRLEC